MKFVISSLVVDYKSLEWMNSHSQFHEMYTYHAVLRNWWLTHWMRSLNIEPHFNNMINFIQTELQIGNDEQLKAIDMCV